MSKKHQELGNKTKRNINLNNFRKEMKDLLEKGKEEYSPKIGRQVKQIKKEIANLEKGLKHLNKNHGPHASEEKSEPKKSK